MPGALTALRLLSECRSYLSASAGAPSAADGVASDSPCKSGLQQLLSPGVQAVQLLHGDWCQKTRVRHIRASTRGKKLWENY